RLRNRTMELEQQITEQKDVQGKSDQHPDVASLLSELESAEEQLAQLSDGSMQVEQRSMSVDPNYARLMEEAVSNSQRVAEIRANIDAVREQKRDALAMIEQLPARSTEYLRLQRQVEIKGEVVANLTENYEMARLSEAGSTASFSIIDEPIPPTMPSGPSLKKVGGIAFIASLLLSMLIAYWRNGATRPPVTDEPPADERVA
ncbi:MAG: GNVR domain-containing protein, partial [Armatimonadota bacterium]